MKHALFAIGVFLYFGYSIVGEAARKRAPEAAPSVATPSSTLTAADLCAQYLGVGNAGATTDFASKTYSVLEFFNPDHGIGLQRPMVSMNVAGRLLALILSQGYDEIPYPFAPDGKIRKYHFFFKGEELTGNRRVIDLYLVTSAFVRQLIEGARSSMGPGGITILVEGAPGTGKSVLLEVLQHALMNTPKFLDEKYWLYSFRFKGLKNLPFFQELYPDQDIFESPHFGSPLALLPKDVKLAFRKKAGPGELALIGQETRFLPEMDFQAYFIVNSLLAHYYPGKKQHSAAEIMEVLEKHVEIFPVTSPETLARKALFLPRQSDEIKFDSLFWSKNAPISMLKGSAHPLAHHIHGAFSVAEVVLLDEFMKQPKAFLDLMLTFFSSGVLSHGNVRLVRDSVKIAVTNSEDIEELKKKDKKSPLLSRLNPQAANWPVIPGSTAAILAYENGMAIEATQLPYSDEAEHLLLADHPALLDKLYPLNPTNSLRMTFPAGRYRIDMLEPLATSKRVHYSPHTDMFLTSIVALTRSVLDPQELAKLLEAATAPPVVGEPVFRNPVSRLRFLLGKGGDVTDSQALQIFSLMKFLREGSFGMDHRDITKILPAARELVAGHGDCITARTLREIFSTLFHDKKLGRNLEESLRWMQYMDIVESRILVPELERDLRAALLGEKGNQAVRAIYREIVFELAALKDDPNAKFYSIGSAKYQIRDKRLRDIQAEYRTITGHELTINQIATLVALEVMRDGGNDLGVIMDEGLKDAILAWQQKQAVGNFLAQGGWDTVLAAGAGRTVADPAIMTRVDSVTETLIRQFGYCPVCAREAFLLVDSHATSTHAHSHSHNHDH